MRLCCFYLFYALTDLHCGICSGTKYFHLANLESCFDAIIIRCGRPSGFTEISSTSSFLLSIVNLTGLSLLDKSRTFL